MVISDLLCRYGLPVRGIVHVGGHQGHQLRSYVEYGINNIIYFEPVENNFYQLKKTISRIVTNQNIKIHKVALGNSQFDANMYIETDNKGMSCSILEPVEHLSQYPWIKFNERERVYVDLMDNYDIPSMLFNMLVVDVQGYEIEVMRGATNTLKAMDYVITEINRAELYRDCAKIEKLHDLMIAHDYQLVEYDWCDITWGDAFYAKRNFIHFV